MIKLRVIAGLMPILFASASLAQREEYTIGDWIFVNDRPEERVWTFSSTAEKGMAFGFQCPSSSAHAKARQFLFVNNRDAEASPGAPCKPLVLQLN
jgi:hypothetical protein